jgi:hypothetical protein
MNIAVCALNFSTSSSPRLALAMSILTASPATAWFALSHSSKGVLNTRAPLNAPQPLALAERSTAAGIPHNAVALFMDSAISGILTAGFGSFDFFIGSMIRFFISEFLIVGRK